MNISKEEFLSAVIDDEAGAFEQRRLLDELQQDPLLGTKFSRYALIGEVMRASGRPAVAQVDLLSRIQLELEDEPAYTEVPLQQVQSKQRDKAQRRVPVWRYAMAASAVLAVVGGVWVLQAQQKQANPVEAIAQVPAAAIPTLSAALPAGTTAMPAANTPTTPVLTTAVLEPSPRYPSRLDPQSRDILKQYVAQHMKYASTTAIVPSVRAVSYSNDY